MSLQATARPGSLLALGVSISNAATFYGLAGRVGNWLTAASGDQIFLDLLDQDEMDILQRRGLIDAYRFNKMWGLKLTILANGRVASFSGRDAK